jgi:acyl phosphate:glycerol-3-phosphate acyltransferase
MFYYAIVVIVSYLLGSIPFGYILVRAFRGEDIRESGSGNIGATNVSRSSPALGILTLLLDALKGFAAVALIRALYPKALVLATLAALFAIIGHIFPLWLKFRGGKGVATGLGSFVMLAPKAILIMLAVFVGVVLVSRHVSLGSIVAVAVFPFLAWSMNSYSHSRLALAYLTAACVLILAKHHENIGRLLHGTEPRFHLRRT